MRIRVTFHAEEDDGENFNGLVGHKIEITGIDRMEMNTPVDFRWDREKGWRSTDLGSLHLEVHGNRPIWDEVEPTELKIITDLT